MVRGRRRGATGSVVDEAAGEGGEGASPTPSSAVEGGWSWASVWCAVQRYAVTGLIVSSAAAVVLLLALRPSAGGGG